MLKQDYLMRMFIDFASAIVRSLERDKNKKDPQGAADMLEEAIDQATDIDASILLTLAPESVASVLQVSGTDPGVIEYLSRSMLLESQFLQEAGNASKANLRKEQGLALAHAYGIEITMEDVSPDALDEFFEETQRQQ